MEVMHKDGQFFVEISGKKAVLDYKLSGKKIDVYHTFTPEELRGQGLAEKLTLAAFEFAKKNNLRVIPTCPYVRDYFVPKHTEFEGIVEK